MDYKDDDKRAAKLALARRKLKDHQEKKIVTNQKLDDLLLIQENIQAVNNNIQTPDIGNQEKSITNEVFTINAINNHAKEPLDPTVNYTEMLISTKRHLENQVIEMQSKLTELESAHLLEINNHHVTKQQVDMLQNELKLMQDKYLTAMNKISELDNNMEKLSANKIALCDENNNLVEQLEFMKTILTAKESENNSLQNQLQQLQNELEVSKLVLHQVNTGLNTSANNNHSEEKEILTNKVNNLEQQLKLSLKEKDQINIHYEHYVSELNEHLKTVMLKNEELTKEVTNLCARENHLIEQISDMEIRLQHVQSKHEQSSENLNNMDTIIDTKVADDKLLVIQEELQTLSKKFNELQELYCLSQDKVKELQEEIKAHSCSHNSISITKLTADIASDKVAAQRATEQNRKLKSSVQELEEAFVKMSQDKLELTEKLTAEKYLNRELTIKLAEIEENRKDMHIKLMAKDEEMIRLQASFRDLEKKFKDISESSKPCDCSFKLSKQNEDINKEMLPASDTAVNNVHRHCLQTYENHVSLPKEDAMLKLQDRFLKIMGDVADLSDEKHRLEHIILQLQNETDTICEYVALYQQQRSLLKKRDEERSEQVKLFQVECERLKSQLEELSSILLKFAEDKELATYFKVDSRQKDMDKVRNLLFNLKTNTLVDPKISLALSNVYPCNCCSGNLIDV